MGGAQIGTPLVQWGLWADSPMVGLRWPTSLLEHVRTSKEQRRESRGIPGIRYCGLEKYSNTKVLEKQRYSKEKRKQMYCESIGSYDSIYRRY